MDNITDSLKSPDNTNKSEETKQQAQIKRQRNRPGLSSIEYSKQYRKEHQEEINTKKMEWYLSKHEENKRKMREKWHQKYKYNRSSRSQIKTDNPIQV